MSESKGKPKTIQDVREAFDADIDNFLEFVQTEDMAVLTPKAYFGDTAFRDILAVVRSLGGDYIRGNKAARVKAHFEVPLEGKGSKPVKVAKDQARHILNTFRADVEALVSKTIKELEELTK